MDDARSGEKQQPGQDSPGGGFRESAQVEGPRWSWFTFLMSVCYSGIFVVVNRSHGQLGERKQKGGARWTPKRCEAADERSPYGLSVSLFSEPESEKGPMQIRLLVRLK